LRVVLARPDELAAHEKQLDTLDAQAEGGSVWRRLAAAM
jgi:hypothetical protein